MLNTIIIDNWIIENINKHLCQCGCNQFIKILRQHYWVGIPEYLRGHKTKGENNPVKRLDVRKKISDAKIGKKNPKLVGENNPAKRPEVKEKIYQKKRGVPLPKLLGNQHAKGKSHIAWNKGLTKENNESLRRMSNKKIGKSSHNKGKKAPWAAGDKNVSHRPEVRKIKSEKLSGKNNPRYGKLPIHTKKSYYQSPLQGRVCFRSSWELAYAKYLDSINELWYYEIETFDIGNNTYTPDFFLSRTNKFIEIKGYMYPKHQEKINKFLEQYPWDLEILRKKDLIKLGVLI